MTLVAAARPRLSRMWMLTSTSRVAHVLTPETRASLARGDSDSVAVFGLCGVVTWRSQAIIGHSPMARVCSLCMSKEVPS